MKIAQYLRRAAALPPRETAQRAWRLARRRGGGGDAAPDGDSHFGQGPPADEDGPATFKPGPVTDVPPPRQWKVEHASWNAPRTVLASVGPPGQILLTSPPVGLREAHDYAVILDAAIIGPGAMHFGLLEPNTARWIEHGTITGAGDHTCPVSFTPDRDMAVLLVLADGRTSDDAPLQVGGPVVTAIQRGPHDPLIPLSEVIPPPQRWKVGHASWDAEQTVVESVGPPGQLLLTSPPFGLVQGADYGFILSFDLRGDGAVVFGLLDPESERWIKRGTITGEGNQTYPLSFRPARAMTASLVVADGRPRDGAPVRIADLAMKAIQRPPGAPPIPLSDLLPAPRNWKVEHASWNAERTVLDCVGSRGQILLTSPPIDLQEECEYGFVLDLEILGDGTAHFGLLNPDTAEWIRHGSVSGNGAHVCPAYFKADRATTVLLALADGGRSDQSPLRVTGTGVTALRRGPHDPHFPASAAIPQPRSWSLTRATWDAERTVLESSDEPLQHLLASPEIEVHPGRDYSFALSFENLEPGAVGFFIYDPVAGKPLLSRTVVGAGPCLNVLPFKTQTRRAVRLVIADVDKSRVHRRVRIKEPSLEVAEYAVDQASLPPSSTDTVLPHWGPLRRVVHGMCRSWRTWNSLVAAIEMRLGRDELISLPQYMALCPTGQCNALCEFCSVTFNRTGIVKQQLPDENLERLLAPVANTVRMYGLDGNGEPTLHRAFPELLQRLLYSGSKVYLITNGSRLSPSVIALLLGGGVDSVNFSLNAATAETHRRVMKLKDFDRVVESIKTLTRGRGDWLNPLVSTSLVVEAKNIHEVQDFLRFSEHDLDVDRIFVRPISELGTDLGAVEDVRDLLPYESDVRDMLDGVGDYLDDTPRRAEIVVVPENFRAVRPDPLDRVLMPLGFEDRLLAPRRGDWTPAPAVRAKWSVNRVRLDAEPSAAGGNVMVSRPIAVDAGSRLRFRARAWSAGFPLEIGLTDETGRTVAGATVSSGEDGAFETVDFVVDTADHEELSIAVRHSGGTLRAEIDFERLRTPAPKVRRTVRLPHPGRWEIDAADADIRWEGSRLHLRRRGNPGTSIVKSYSVPCMPECDVSLAVRIELRSGGLGIGVLSQDASRYIAQLRLEEAGDTAAAIEFNTGENSSFRLALYGLETPKDGDQTLDATVDWLDRNLDLAPDHWQGLPSLAAAAKPRTNRRRKAEAIAAPGDQEWATPTTANIKPGLPPHAATQPAPGNLPGGKARPAGWVISRPDRIRQVVFPKAVHYGNAITEFAATRTETIRTWLRSAAKKIGRSAFFRIVHRLVYGRTRFYCQKPWTDLANFSVDGRMDVCCIATGASQERFALGNLMHQDFQEVWNGETAREFRRTVNSDAPLPPCRRCPMAYGYQGPFFDRVFTLGWIRDSMLGAGLFRWLRGWRGAGVLQYVTFYPLVYAFYLPFYLVLNFIWFRNFKR